MKALALIVALLVATGCSDEPGPETPQRVPSAPITQQVCDGADLPRAARALGLAQRSSTRGTSTTRDSDTGPSSTASCSATWRSRRPATGADVTLIGDRFADRATAQRRWDFVESQALEPTLVGGAAADLLPARRPEGRGDAAAASAGVAVVPANGGIRGDLVEQTILRHWVLDADTIYTVILTSWTPAAGADRDATLAAMQSAADEIVARAG